MFSLVTTTTFYCWYRKVFGKVQTHQTHENNKLLLNITVWLTKKIPQNNKINIILMHHAQFSITHMHIKIHATSELLQQLLVFKNELNIAIHVNYASSFPHLSNILVAKLA